MKKHILISIFLLLSSYISYSAYLENYPVELIQPNGSTFKCFASGDEFYNFLHTEDGFVIKQADDGYFYFAEKINDAIVPSIYRIQEHNPNLLKLQKWVKPDISIVRENFANHNQIKEIAFKRKENQIPYTQITKSGKVNNLVIFVTFSDQKEFVDSIGKYDKLMNNEESISMRNYYRLASYNQFDVETHFCPISEDNIVSIKYEKSRDYFTPYNATTNPNGYKRYGDRYERERELLDYVIDKASIEYTDVDVDFDSDDDNRIDNIVFIIRGKAEGWSELLWPHRSWYSGSSKFKGKEVMDYNFILSDIVDNSRYGLGTFCHEFFHSLGAPDLYRYYEEDIAPVGSWDLMANTNNPPQFMCNLLKYQYTGWVQSLPEITSEGEYFLYPTTSPTNNIYKLKSPNSANEFFVLEYRKKEGKYDNNLPGSGLLVYRVDNTMWMEGNAGGPPDEIYLFRKDGFTNIQGNLNEANLCSEVERTSISDLTNPSLFFADGSNAGIEIYDISDCGEIISFKIGYTVRTVIVYPINNSFDLPLMPVIRWRASVEANNYQIQLSSDADFNDILLDNTVNDTLYSFYDNLDYSSDYFVRVRWKNQNITSDWSEICSFSTHPNNTEILFPANNSEDITILPAFIWKAIPNNNVYQIIIAEDKDFENIYFKKNFILDSTYKISKLLQTNTTYYCKIKSTTITGYQSESSVCKFTTKANDLIVASQSNSIDVCKYDSVSLYISVIGNISKYEWYFNYEIIPSATDSILNISSFNENNDGDYYCKVYSPENNLTAESKLIRVNLINPPELIDIPNQIKATLGNNIEIQVEIDTSDIDINTNYSFQWLKDSIPLNDGTKYSGSNSLSLFVAEISEEDISSKYSLMISTKCGDTVYSKATSIVILGIEDNEEYSNFIEVTPNPAFESFNISFYGKNGETEILLYDLNGFKVAKLWKGSLQEGVAHISVNIKDLNLNSAVYIISVKNQNQFLTKKVSIIK